MGVKVSVALCVDGPSVAVNVSGEVAETSDVVTVKVALVKFAPIDTEAGYLTDESPPDRATTTPPGPAPAVSLIVPIALLPPITVAGATVRLERIPAGFTVSEADFVTEFKVAASVSTSVVETTDVVTVKVTVVDPEGTVTVAG